MNARKLMKHFVIALWLISWLVGCSTTPIAGQKRASAGHGDVNLLVRVSSNGDVVSVNVRDSDLPKLFQDSAIRSVKTWHFQPALSGGKPVEAWFLVPIHIEVGELGKTNSSNNSIQPTAGVTPVSIE